MMFRTIGNRFLARTVSYTESPNSEFRYRPLRLKLKEGNFEKAVAKLLPGEELYRADPDNLVMGRPFLVLVDGKKHFESCLDGSRTFVGHDLYAGIPDPEEKKKYDEFTDRLHKRVQRFETLC